VGRRACREKAQHDSGCVCENVGYSHVVFLKDNACEWHS
jgi:hypothetical protein